MLKVFFPDQAFTLDERYSLLPNGSKKSRGTRFSTRPSIPSTISGVRLVGDRERNSLSQQLRIVP